MARKPVKINPIRGEHLKALLSRHHMAHQDLAEKIGYSKEHISYVVNGKRNLTEDMADSIIQKVFPTVRKEYLLGIDEYETLQDVQSAKDARIKASLDRIFEDGDIVIEFLHFIARSKGYNMKFRPSPTICEDENGTMIVTVNGGDNTPYCALIGADGTINLDYKQVIDLCNRIFLQASFIFDMEALNKYKDGCPFYVSGDYGGGKHNG